MKSRKYLILSAVLFLTVLTTKVYPYERTTRFGVPVSWQGAMTGMDLHPTSFPDDDRNPWTASLKKALDDWTGVMGSDFEFAWDFVARNSRNHFDGNNAVAFVGSGCDDWIGVAFVRTHLLAPWSIAEVDIEFDSNCNNWMPNDPNRETTVNTRNRSFLHTAQHELGHALGLAHEFNTVSAMNYGIRQGEPPIGIHPFERLQGDDKNGVRAIYPGFGTDIDLSVTNAASAHYEYLGHWYRHYQRYVSPPTPSQVMPGEAIQVEYTAQNMGNVPLMGVSIGFYLDDYFIDRSYFNLPAHSLGTFTRSLNIPPSIPPGDYKLYVFIDDDDRFSESDEGNNRLPNPYGVIHVHGPPEAPDHLRVDYNPNHGTFELSWWYSRSVHWIDKYTIFHEYTVGGSNYSETISVDGIYWYHHFANLPVADHTFRVSARDTRGQESPYSSPITVTVIPPSVNSAPVLRSIGNQLATIGDDYSLAFEVSGFDPEGDTLTYSATPLPDGAGFNPQTRYFVWKPTTASQGGLHNITFKVTDSLGAYDTETIQIRVTTAPTLSPIGNKIVYVGDTLSFQIYATDPDHGPLTYTANNIPSGSLFFPALQGFNWTPTASQVRTYDVDFKVTDSYGAYDEERIVIDVRLRPEYRVINPRPPVLDGVEEKNRNAGPL